MSDDEVTETIDRLLSDLEIGPAGRAGEVASHSAAPTRNLDVNLADELGAILAMQPNQMLRVGLDVAVFVGFAGDWDFSLKVAGRMLELNDDRLLIKLWQLRCLVELARFAEAVALASSLRWPAEHMIHVNYLTGAALESLGMRDQAQVRYRAVYDADSTYRDVALRLVSR